MIHRSLAIVPQISFFLSLSACIHTSDYAPPLEVLSEKGQNVVIQSDTAVKDCDYLGEVDGKAYDDTINGAVQGAMIDARNRAVKRFPQANTIVYQDTEATYLMNYYVTIFFQSYHCEGSEVPSKAFGTKKGEREQASASAAAQATAKSSVSVNAQAAAAASANMAAQAAAQASAQAAAQAAAHAAAQAANAAMMSMPR